MNTTIKNDIQYILDQLEHTATSKNNAFQLNANWHIGRLLHQTAKSKNWQEVQIRKACSNWSVSLQSHKPSRNKYLYKCYRFYKCYNYWEEVAPDLSWSHYQQLVALADKQQRLWYTHEATSNQWTAKELSRQIKAQYYKRQLSADSQFGQSTDEQQSQPRLQDLLKDNYVLEFTSLSGNYKERDLEEALLDQLQAFLMELGKGFSFVARQKRVVLNSGKQFYIDLVFYHFILKRFVLIDLKITPLSHRDIGQMDMYVRLYEQKWRGAGDEATIGIILCPEKDTALEQYSSLQDSDQLYAATYQLQAPLANSSAQPVALAGFHASLMAL